MAELFESAEEPEAEPSAAVQTDAAAIDVALDRSRRKRKTAPTAGDEADRFLAKQEALIDDQRAHLHVQLRTLGLDHWSKRLRLAGQALTIFVGLVVVGVLGCMAASAASADGITIKPFSAPPTLVQRGLTGEALASRVMDQLSEMAEESRTSERQKAVDADWGEHISIEIPETGVSLSQLDQWLREKLGHQRRITGEVSFTPDGKLELGARIGAHVLPTQTGGEAELDAMVTRLAEAIYAREQPSSYYLYLALRGRWDEAFALGKARSTSRDPGEQSSGLLDMGQAMAQQHGLLAAVPYYEKALTTSKINPAAAANLGSIEWIRGHWQRVYELDRRWPDLIKSWDRYSPEAAANFQLQARQNVLMDVNDSPHALALAERTDFSLGQMYTVAGSTAVNFATMRADLHDIAAAGPLCDDGQAQGPARIFEKAACGAWVARRAEDWPGIVSQVEAARALVRTSLPTYADRMSLLDAQEAWGMAKLGRFAEAHGLLDALAADNVHAVLARGVLADAEGHRAEAERWFADAVRLAPSLPEPLYWQAKARLDHGDATGAIAPFNKALTLSPNYPDVLVGRAEARLMMGDAKAARDDLAKAGQLAPHWGRLHLKWAQALVSLGRADEARAQLKTAATLDLTPAERVELGALKL